MDCRSSVQTSQKLKTSPKYVGFSLVMRKIKVGDIHTSFTTRVWSGVLPQRLHTVRTSVWHEIFLRMCFSCSCLFVLCKVQLFSREANGVVHYDWERPVTTIHFCQCFNETLLTLRRLMSYIYVWSTHSWCF